MTSRVQGGLDRNFALMTAGTFGFWAAVAAHIPLLPFYLSDLGVDAATIGGIYGSAALFAILGRVAVVSIVDTRGERLPLLIGTGLWAVTAMVPPFTDSVVLVAISWAAKGLGLGIFTTAASAWVARYMEEEKRGRGLSWWSSTNPVASVIAPPIAVWIIADHGYVPAFMLATLFSIMAMLSALVPSTAEPNPDGKKTRFLVSAISPGVIGLFLAIVATGFTIFIPLSFQESSPELAGWPLALYAGGSFAIRFVSAPALDKYGARRTIPVGLVGAALGTTLLAFPGSFIIVLVGATLLGAGVGVLAPALATWTADRSAPEVRGAATGTYFLIYEIGLMSGGAIFGVALSAVGDMTYVAAAMALLLVGNLVIIVSRRSNETTTNVGVKES